ncbi:MAG: hypothetical protein QOJ07_3888 [Thermoleophilaceae bacterium]|nr:hypothetical protein [Thermoleophilaceae bacterium]
MTTLMTEQFAAPSSRRTERALEDTRRRSADGLGDRTVWCAGSDLADALRRALEPGCISAPFALDAVRPQDVVVLDAEPSPELANDLRERGAHVMWHLDTAPAHAAPAVDAYLVTWIERPRPGRIVQDLAALLPCSGIVVAKEIATSSRTGLGWSALLADAVHADRDETVGGRRHVRPAVAAR